MLAHKTTVRIRDGCAQFSLSPQPDYRGARDTDGVDATGAELGMLALGLAVFELAEPPNDGLYVSRDPTEGDAGGEPR